MSLSLTLILFLHKVGKHYHHSIKYKGKWMARGGGGRSYGVIIVVLVSCPPAPTPHAMCRVYPSVHKVLYPYTTSPIIASAQLFFSLDNRGLVHPVAPISSRGSRGGEGGWGGLGKWNTSKTNQDRRRKTKWRKTTSYMYNIKSSSNAGKAANYISFSF